MLERAYVTVFGSIFDRGVRFPLEICLPTIGSRADSSIFELMMKYILTTIASKSNVLAGSLSVPLRILYAFLSLRK